MKVLLFVKNSHNAINTAQALQRFLQSKSVEVEFFVNEPGKKPREGSYALTLVVGGDGTFLAGARFSAVRDVPIMGVNEGKFGFLTEIDKEEAFEYLEKVLDGRLKPQKRMLVCVFVDGKLIGHYLNDVVLSKLNLARMVEVDVFAQDEFMVRVYGDGVIISTPTGSTAYALSAGGPIIHPTMEALLFVPICPHTLSNRPMLIHSDFRIKLLSNSPTFLSLDGQEGMEINPRQEIWVEKSPFYCTLYTHPKRSFFYILREKLSWGR